MKRIVSIAIGVALTFTAIAQTPPGFTAVNQNYDWLGGRFRNTFGITPKDTLTAPLFIGELRLRTTGGDSTLYAGLSLTGKKWFRQGGGSSQSATEFGLISGGVVTHASGLTFDVTAATYYINGILYTSPSSQITLDPADPSNPRADVIAVDNTGTVVKLTGDAASTPVEPQVDPSTQIFLTRVDLGAGATTPTGVSSVTIYDENTEWTIEPQGVTANGANTTNVYQGTKSVNVSGWVHFNQIAFINGSVLNSTDYETLKLFVKLKSVLNSSANITATFYNGGTAASNELYLTGYGLSKTNTSTYQNVSIPFSAFTFSGAFDRLRIRFIGSNSSGVYLDAIALKAGIVTQPTVQGLQNAYTSVTDGTTSAIASGGDRLKFRSSDGSISVTVGNNHATHGDNVDLKVPGLAAAYSTITPFPDSTGLTLNRPDGTRDTIVGEAFMLTTTDIPEGTNLYYTDARVKAAFKQTKAWTLTNPIASENIALFYTDVAITVTKLAEALKGTTPSVTYQINHSTDRSSGSPNTLFSSGRTATSTSGTTTTTFNDATIPAGSWIWITTSAVSGTVDGINITLIYSID